jgi:hypothetical protein
MLQPQEAAYAAELSSVLNRVIAEVFGESITAAHTHAVWLFGTEMTAIAARAGCSAHLTTIEAIAALSYLEWHRVEHGTSKSKRLINGQLRKRHGDLAQLCVRTVVLIQDDLGPNGRVRSFADAMVEQMKSP